MKEGINAQQERAIYPDALFSTFPPSSFFPLPLCFLPRTFLCLLLGSCDSGHNIIEWIVYDANRLDLRRVNGSLVFVKFCSRTLNLTAAQGATISMSYQFRQFSVRLQGHLLSIGNHAGLDRHSTEQSVADHSSKQRVLPVEFIGAIWASQHVRARDKTSRCSMDAPRVIKNCESFVFFSPLLAIPTRPL